MKISRLKKLLVGIFCVVSLSSCGAEDDEQEWFPDPQVYSIRLQYNNQNIDGQFEADISMESLVFTAKIVKDQGSYFPKTFASSDTLVAEINQNGEVTLKREGETVISVSAGDKSHEIVLIVTNEYSTHTSYSLTVMGGHAVDLDGQIVTSAEQYEYLTLVPDVPTHKGFLGWNYSVENVWTSGNAIKMPASDLLVTANYEDELYKLTLVGAQVSKAGDEDDPVQDEIIPAKSIYDVKNIYHFAYGTEITIKALEAPENKLFVGFDYNNVEDNRIGDEGREEYTFTMSDEDSTYKSVYSSLSKNALHYDSAAKFTYSGATVTKIQDSSDADLKGYYGYQLDFNGTISPIKTGYTENITRTNIDTMTTFNPLTMEVLFKNENPNYSIDVELYLSYFGNLSTTGVVTVPASSTIKTYMHANICVPSACSWGFAIRDSITGATSSDQFRFKFAVGAAHTYPNGYPLTKVGSDYQLLNFDTTTITNGGYPKSTSGWGSPGRVQYHDSVGGMFWASYASTFGTRTGEYKYINIANYPSYDADKPISNIYFKALNLVNNIDEPINEFTIYVVEVPSGTSTSDPTKFNPTSEDVTVAGSLHVKLEKVNEVYLDKMEVTRTSSSTNMFLVIAKDHLEGTDRYAHNVFMQFAYNNVFGYIEE